VRIYQGLNRFYPNDPAAEPTDYVSNLPKGCKVPYMSNYLGWRGVYMGEGGCSYAEGSGYIIGRDSIRITYQTVGKTEYIEQIFLGKRIR
jgi:hypothetical protein